VATSNELQTIFIYKIAPKFSGYSLIVNITFETIKSQM
jgi:hypothetical protein